MGLATLAFVASCAHHGKSALGAIAFALAVSGTACFESSKHLPDGGLECTAVDEYRQTETSPTTFLWVIDDSPSMCEEQANLRANLAAFASAAVAAAPGLRFHMGVVTTDTVDPTRRGRLVNAPVMPAATPSCPNPSPALDCTTGLPDPLPKWVDETMVEDGTYERIFACLSSVGTGGFGAETPLGAAYMALSPALLSDPTANAGFLIPGSRVVVLIVSDEDDCTVCVGADCGPLADTSGNPGDCDYARASELASPEELAAMIQALDNDGNTFGKTGVLVATVSGLDGSGNSTGATIPDPAADDSMPAICSVPGQGSAAPAPRLETFARSFVDHLEYSICDSDWGPSAAEINQRIGSYLFAGCLQNPPCPGAAAADFVARTELDGVARTLVPGLDYDVLCAGGGGAPTCPSSANADCPTGWRFLPLSDDAFPAGSLVSVVYGCDAGDGCAP